MENTFWMNGFNENDFKCNELLEANASCKDKVIVAAQQQTSLYSRLQEVLKLQWYIS